MQKIINRIQTALNATEYEISMIEQNLLNQKDIRTRNKLNLRKNDLLGKRDGLKSSLNIINN